jgi:hypothetical protein
MNAPHDTVKAPLSSQQRPDASSLHHYFSQAYTSLVQAHRQHSQHLESQGRQSARDLMADSHVTADEVMTVLAKYSDSPAALAAFFEALGPRNSANALRYVNYQARDVMGSPAFTQLADRDDGPLKEGNRIKAWRHEQRHELREILAEALGKGAEGGLSDDFIQGMAKAAGTDPKAANQLSNILSQCDDKALLPLKAAVLNALMIPEKALSGNADTQPWVRAATLLLGSDPSGQLADSLQEQAGSRELTHFITTAVKHSAKATIGLDGLAYYDEYYQQGFDGLLKGLSQLQGEQYTDLKAHLFSTTSDAMGEHYTRKELTEGLKALFVSDPEGIAMEIMSNSNHLIASPTAFSFFFKEAIFNNPNPNDKFIEAVSLTLKDLYKNATDSSMGELEDETSSMTLGLLFGSLRAAFDDAKVDNKADQDAVRNMVNVLTGFATIFPQISTQLAAAKDGVVVPTFDFLLNGNNRLQAEKLDLIDDKFHEILRVMLAGFNGYKEETGRSIRSDFSSAFALTHDEGANKLGKI